MFDGRFRSSVDKGVGPIGSALGRTGLSPDHLTALGLVMSVPAAVTIASGRLALGLVLLVASAIPDLLDGALAKASGTSSTRGAFFDSVADRVTDAIIMGGVAWYLQSSRHGHAGMLPFGILAVSTLISYERAKAESLGFTAKGGLMERAERIILLCVGLFLPVVLVPILWVMLVLTSVTAVQRFAKVWRQATHAAAREHLAAAAAAPPGGAESLGVAESAPLPAFETPAVPADVVAPRAAVRHGTGATSATGTAGVDGVEASTIAPSADAAAAVAERWRAWRQQTAARQAGDQMATAARPTGPGRGADGIRRSTRWEERRAARLRAESEDKRAQRTPRRRHSTR
ncbi:MAG: CDP-diacylglycerol---glycerol-3-phosphate 3-phosphatidyltransferase, partial [Acidimicrobiaceae bacterium]|nr:CDP-diacylglycerol---glycerol-3-phosphate 3-phosphatidyltransferase [Acidimicrobiaceae bacterium]